MRFRVAQRNTANAQTTSTGNPTARARLLERSRTASRAPRNSLDSCSTAMPATTATPRPRPRLDRIVSGPAVTDPDCTLVGAKRALVGSHARRGALLTSLLQARRRRHGTSSNITAGPQAEDAAPTVQDSNPGVHPGYARGGRFRRRGADAKRSCPGNGIDPATGRACRHDYPARGGDETAGSTHAQPADGDDPRGLPLHEPLVCGAARELASRGLLPRRGSQQLEVGGANPARPGNARRRGGRR